ncbi:MAG: N-6 DNA methylase, partial [Gammaproteobacteria bacterium]|nr:N-6 DNA methylase [Gammaproteobacteria bacterium]
VQTVLSFPEIGEWRDAIYAKIVQKCGDRRYWESWAGDVAQIAERHKARIEALIEGAHPEHRALFDDFLAGLRKNLNPSITEADAIEMLSQHLITKPVFDALFAGYSFADHNPVSQSMQKMVDLLEGQALEKETTKLTKFYEDVRARAQGIDNAEGRQRVILELYDKFFRTAFPRMAERLGIVYTPVEVVDFILQSAEVALQKHFGAHLADAGVQILDPFIGTGTFIVRLLQSGLIKPEDLPYKYTHEMHANEIVLLAYYIAAINIESAYHAQTGQYEPFDGIVLTDTFQMGEDGGQDGLARGFSEENSDRVNRQKRQDIRVIIGNPPYSVGQTSANDNNQNLAYPTLDERIRKTYAAQSTATLKNSLYDSYIRAIRWASDRIKDDGVIAFVTNGSFIDGNAADGLRKSLTSEFSHLYVFNLRGNARTQGEQRRKEAGGIFGEGSRAPVAITILVKDQAHTGSCALLYHDIGDYLGREEKLATIQRLHDIGGVEWAELTPNAEGDWINARNPVFETFMELGNKENKSALVIFSIHSSGVKTNRDAWVYNFSRGSVETNMRKMIQTYNGEVDRYAEACVGLAKDKHPRLENFLENDPRKISWDGSLYPELQKARRGVFNAEHIAQSVYRPFVKTWLYFDRLFNNRVYQMPRLFPTPAHENIVISATGIGASKAFSALVSDCIPNLHMHDTGQCFPLYWYEKAEDAEAPDPRVDMFSDEVTPDTHGYIRHEAITDAALAAFQDHYGDKTIGKEDLFWYVYGILHSPEYKERF